MSSRDASRISAAAEELVKAACMDADISSQQKLTSELASLKDTLKGRLDKVSTQLDTSQQKLSSELASLKTQLDTLNANIQRQTKVQSLQWAIQNASIESFQYRSKHGPEDSANLVQGILLSFRQDRGHYLPMDAYISDYGHCTEESKKKFQDSLVAQIYTLTGVKPVIKIGSNDKDLAIYYSS